MSIDLIIVILSYILGAVFAAFETALAGSDSLRIYAHVRHPKQLKRTMRLFQDKSRYINSLVVSLNIMTITITVFTFNIFKHYFSLVTAGTVATIVTIIGLLIFTEVFPKFIGFYYPRFILVRFYTVIEVCRMLTLPIVSILDLITKWVFPNLINKEKRTPVSRKAVEKLFRSSQEEFTSQQLVEMINNALTLDEVTIKECKTPIHQLTAFSATTTIKEFREEIKYSYYSRVPIYRRDIFHISGYVLSHEVLSKGLDDQLLSDYEYEGLFYPENVTVEKIVDSMTEKNIPIVFTVDEFGAVSGMLTNKDLNEIIIGNFQDDRKHSYTHLPIVEKDHGWLVSGRQDIDHLNLKLGLNIQKKGFETVSGFVMTKLSKIPKLGDDFEYKGFHYKVVEMRGAFFCQRILIQPKQDLSLEM